jgi:hypothetical protein
VERASADLKVFPFEEKSDSWFLYGGDQKRKLPERAESTAGAKD